MNIYKTLKDNKTELLAYFRDRASEFLTDIKQKFAETQSDKRARLDIAYRRQLFFNIQNSSEWNCSQLSVCFL